LQRNIQVGGKGQCLRWIDIETPRFLVDGIKKDFQLELATGMELATGIILLVDLFMQPAD